MKNEKSIGTNAVLNVIKQGLSVLFPLITYPYALRVLGAEGMGKIAYVASIISYFALIAKIGIPTYAVREGAKRKGNKEKFNQFASEIFTINIIFTLLSYAFLLIAVLYVDNFYKYKLLILFQSISIISETICVDWVNTIHEDFAIITLRSIMARIINLILLFVMVKTVEDYYAYVLISVIPTGLFCIINWFYCKKYVNIRITAHPHISQHIKTLLILFANSIAVSIYVNIDITMLGWMKGDTVVGLYSLPVKLYTILKDIMAAIYIVSIARLAFYIGENRKGEYRELYTKLWSYLVILLIPLSIGISCIATELMTLIGGEEFVESAVALKILMIALIFAIFGGLVTACLNITLGREKENFIATIISAILNFTLNIFFIPTFGYYGAAITTFISEIFVFLFCFCRLPDKKGYFNFKYIGTSILHAFIGSICMIIYAFIIKKLFNNILTKIIVVVMGSVIIYTTCLILCKDRCLKEIFFTLKNKFLNIVMEELQ